MSRVFPEEKIDEYLFLGDAVGYGADPRACISELKKLRPSVVVSGNHEWGVLGLLDMEYFNEYAEAAIEWTRRFLNKEELDYIRSWRLFCESENFTIVHGSLEQPASFKYISNEADAGLTLKFSRTPLCFVAHTHVPAVYRFDKGGLAHAAPLKIRVEKDSRYIINVGSIGQPRDGDPRAAFVIYDEKESTVEVKRVAYDVKSAQRKIIKAGLPAWLASRLEMGR